MKKLMLAVAFFSFVGLTSVSAASFCEDGKKCDKKECTHKKGDAKKECSSKDAKKACCSKDKASASTEKASCHAGDKTAEAGKSCCASKAKTEEKKAE